LIYESLLIEDCRLLIVLRAGLAITYQSPNQESTTQNAHRSTIIESPMEKSVFSKHHDELEKHETMMGRDRGRLAVAMDLLTDALAMVGQHGVYCQSARHPGKPTMDVSMVLEQISDAKELLQSVIEAERS
jgi:hypothetical protein